MTTLIETERSFLKTHNFEDHNELITQCIEDIHDKLIENPKIMIFGKPGIQHRSVGFFSNDSIGYYFVGQLERSKVLTPNLILLIDIINKYFNTDFNGILVNKYKDGNDYIGAHSDTETKLDKSVGVIAISYGAIRKFRIRNKKTKQIIVDIPTLPYNIIHMGGDFQKEFTHEIPIEKKIKDVRYSLTFRKHYE